MRTQFTSWLIRIWKYGRNSPKFLVGLIGLGLGILGIVGGIITFFESRACQGVFVGQTGIADQQHSESGQVSALNSTSSGQIVVDVAGGIKNPGIYELAPDSRIYAALEKAGGLTSMADLGYIQQHLNLAEKLQEGEKIYFPLIQKSDTCTSQSSPNSGSSKLISLNFSSAAELDSLPGLGEKLSAKIIAGRPYSSLDELVSRIKISQSIFDKIRAQLEL